MGSISPLRVSSRRHMTRGSFWKKKGDKGVFVQFALNNMVLAGAAILLPIFIGNQCFSSQMQIPEKLRDCLGSNCYENPYVT